MKRSFSQRERSLLGIAISLYEKLGNSTSKNLEKLNVDCLLLNAALLNIIAIRGKLATSSIDAEIEFTNDLRLTARDAIELTFQKAEKVKEDQQDLRALRRAFADQSSLPFELETRETDKDTTTTVSVNGGKPVPLDSPEAEKQMRDVVRKTMRRGEQPSAPPA